MDSQEVEEDIGCAFFEAFPDHDASDPEILRRLAQNDPGIQSLNVNLYDDRNADHPDWAKEVGRAISKSTHLGILYIDDPDEPQPQPPPPFGLPSFFMGLAENRSIQDLYLNGFNHSHMDIFTTLAPFFEKNLNLRCISMRGSIMLREMRVPSLISALGKTVGLHYIDIANILLDDSMAADLINAFKSMTGLYELLELCLGGNKIGQQGCSALRKLLRHPSCNIQCLHINNNHFDNVCMDILNGGLVTNKSIKFIDINHQQFVTAFGWGSFFDLFCSNSNCSVEQIDANENDVGDAGAISLGDSFAVKRTITMLDLQNSRCITQVGWQGFSEGLRSPNCSLLKLNISRCEINDEGALAVASALGENTSLEELNMSNNRNISSPGWIDCFHIMRQYKFRLKELDLSGNNIDDLGVTMLVTILVKMSALVSFSLSEMTSVSADGWREFADVMKSSSSSKLHALNLGRLIGQEVAQPLIDDSVLTCFADSLIGNTSLMIFEFFGYDHSDVGLRALANSLCDKSSPTKTFCSNHTLRYFRYLRGLGINYQKDLRSLINMNQSENKADEVARKKILANHFGDGDACVRVFAPMTTPTLPTALSWIGKDRREYSMMYYLLHSMPWPLESRSI